MQSNKKDSRKIQKMVWRFSRDGKQRQVVPVVREEVWGLSLENQDITKFCCSGRYLAELAIGYLKYLGLLKCPEDISEVSVNKEKKRLQVKLAAGCEKSEQILERKSFDMFGTGEDKRGAKTDSYALTARLTQEPSQLFHLMEQLNASSKLYKTTHGVHNSALATSEDIVVFRDDIGRHNTIDMLHGYSFMRKIPLKDKILITTCRITSQIVKKVIRMGVPIVVSRGITTNLAMSLAEKADITLVGFLRGYRFIVYT